MTLGPRKRAKNATRLVPLSLKVVPEFRAKMEAAAEASGRSLAAEVQYRIVRYDDLALMAEILERQSSPLVYREPMPMHMHFIPDFDA